jgi:hypothetical protein
MKDFRQRRKDMEAQDIHSSTSTQVQHETTMKFMRGEIRGWEIPAEDVLPYTPGSKVECIVMGMVTIPGAAAGKRA